jgi:hypothetical protein
MLGIVVATTRAKAMAAALKISTKDVGNHGGDVILTIEQAIAAGGERIKTGPVKGRDMAKGYYYIESLVNSKPNIFYYSA